MNKRYRQRYTKPRTLKTDSYDKKLGRGERKGRILLRKSLVLLTPWLELPASTTVKRIHFCWFKLPSLWYFVTEVLRNQ